MEAESISTDMYWFAGIGMFCMAFTFFNMGRLMKDMVDGLLTVVLMTAVSGSWTGMKIGVGAALLFAVVTFGSFFLGRAFKVEHEE